MVYTFNKENQDAYRLPFLYIYLYALHCYRFATLTATLSLRYTNALQTANKQKNKLINKQKKQKGKKQIYFNSIFILSFSYKIFET